ncbi:unnamed protein product [Caenorhabditis auriculariae]|uniref:Uncharacterized protein n=1 Tax=Caenorhabditis auriculariae TaxID=2777116 RepID=A0A8S1HTG9_9PELO|nr:unnamed protein product [Caenorhabditis auriculariae]
MREFRRKTAAAKNGCNDDSNIKLARFDDKLVGLCIDVSKFGKMSGMRFLIRFKRSVLISRTSCSPLLPAGNRAFVLKELAKTVSIGSVVTKLDEQLVLLIINLATQEMTMTKDADVEWAEAARELLVTLARSSRFANHVIDAVLQKFPPGLTTSPHRYIVLTMATIAEHNPFALVKFLTDILSRTVPLLQHVKTDPLRCAWARAICSFCEAVRECETERPKEASEDLECNGDSRPGSAAEVSQEVSNRATYSDQTEAVYDVIFQWIYSKDPKTRGESAECVGELCLMIRQMRLVEDVKKIVTNLIPLYKKAYNETHMITMGICRFLEAACVDDVCPLEPYLEDILNALFPNACLDPDDNSVTLSPQAIKNHSEAFRCFHVAATRFADRIVYYLLHKMQNVSDTQKLGAINVLRHLLNSSGQHMEDKRSLLMMGLRKLLAAENTTSIRVKRAIVQLCVALADHAYVDAEGGDYVIAFLVRNLVAPTEQEVQTRKLEVDVAGSNQLRTQCAQALHTIASTCICANKLLWPYLLEFVCAERYTPVVGDICKCLRTLITRELQNGNKMDFETGFDNARVAGRHAVFARLYTCLCNAPLNGLLARRAREAGGLIKALDTWFHPNIAQVSSKWTEKLEPLLDELSAANVSSPTGESPPAELRGRKIARWHEACLEWLSLCVSSVVDGTWRTEIAAAMGKQLDMYKDMADEKAFLLRCLGTTLAKIANKQFVVEHLMLMFKSTAHALAAERQGCARGVGAVATAHTELVLVELENVSKWEHAKRSSGIFGFIKDTMPMRQYPDAEMVSLRATLMLCYGHVVMACPIDTVTQRLQHTVLVFLRHYFANCKQDIVVREALLETMRLIAMAVHPTRIGNDWTFDARNELLSYLREYVQSESPEMLASSLRLLAAKAAAALVQLEPALDDNDIWELSRVLTQYILPMCREKSGLKTLAYDLFDFASSSVLSTLSSATGGSFTASSTTSSATSEGPNGTPVHRVNPHRKMEDDESATIMDATVHQYGLALEQLVRMRPTTNTVTLLLKMLQAHYGKVAEHERSRAIDATVLVLRVYYECAEDITLGHASDFGPLSSLLGRLSPRMADSLAHVRIQSLAAIHWAFRLAYMHKGHGRYSDSSLFSFEQFSNEYLAGEGKLDGQTAKRAVKAMSQVIECRLPQSQMQTYLTAVFEMLTDRQSQVSSAAAQLLTYALTSRGTTLVAEAETLVSTLLAKLSEVHSCVHTYPDLLAAVVAFAAHQQQPVCDVILKQPLPYSETIADAWKCISRDRYLFAGILDHLLELLNSSLDQPYEVVDIGAGSSAKIAHVEPCQYVAAVAQVIENGEPETALIERLPLTLALLMQFVCSVADTQFPVIQKEVKDGTKLPLIITPELRRAAEKPAGMAVAAIRSLLERTRSVTVIEDMNQARGWTECLDRDQFIVALTAFVRSLVEQRPAWVAPLSRSVEEFATNESEPRRLAAVIVASALIRKSPNETGDFNEQLLVRCVRRLEDSLTDPSLRIRKLCVKGLGELSECSSKDVVQRFVGMAVEAAMAGLDDLGDRRDTVAMESILALNKLVSRTNDAQLTTILPQVLLKIRPCFEKDSPSLRSASFSLFGELGARVGESYEEFRGHLHTNVVSLILHLNDDFEDVRQKCALSLFRLHPLLTSSEASILLERELANGRLPASYSSFVKDFAMILSLAFPDRVNQYALATSNYFKSSSPRIRSNAALLTGCLLEGLGAQLRATISKDLIFTGLVALLKDPEDVHVRIEATRAIASLRDFH